MAEANANSARFATIDRAKPMTAVLKVVGVGGGGCNAIESMIRRGLTGVEYVAVNTDAQALASSSANQKVHIGTAITRGLGAGADPGVGKKAVEEDREKMAETLAGSDMVFITAGMGGGTGTGAAPVIASIAKSIGALVVGIVTKPFSWEGKKRMLNAEKGILELKQYVDSLIVIPNNRLLSIIDKGVSAFTSFDKPNEVLYEATRGIADIITVEGVINVDFADVRSVMNESGDALMGCGVASGENRAIEAAQKAISSPLLEGVNIKGAKSVLLNVTGSSNITMEEINEGNNVIYQAAGEEANIIFGLVKREELNDYISYTVIATGFDTGTVKGYGKKGAQMASSEPIFTRKGFVFGNGEEIEQDDLQVPTFIRVNGAKSNMQNETNENPQGGFSIDPYIDSAKDRVKKQNDDVNSKDDEDESSSFLRMIMD
jgi:cell division protein FtsZ